MPVLYFRRNYVQYNLYYSYVMTKDINQLLVYALMLN